MTQQEHEYQVRRDFLMDTKTTLIVKKIHPFDLYELNRKRAIGLMEGQISLGPLQVGTLLLLDGELYLQTTAIPAQNSDIG